VKWDLGGDPGELGDWVEVFVTYDPIEAEIVRNLLESGGIRVRVVSMRVGPYPVNIGRMGETRLQVRRRDARAARQAISELQQNN
jgi:hypothetical protein